MRMSDRPTVDVCIHIEAPAARVWQLVTDIVLMGQWSPEYQGGEWLDGASGPTVGARFKGRNKRRDREWEGCNRSIPGILWLKSPFPKLSLCWKTELYFLKQKVSYHGDFEDILKMSR